ncbi:MAG: branched-chain amino acid transaminase [Deltaproteobacteria bacterium]|nr:branched-chain amino acid transaminase [Deltaproteobacteria bacterium]MBW2253321.1 branched-chain amino acid transaminase [Deltaproteobacteria bacterium]
MGVESKYIWFDGELVPFDEARVHVLCHSLHYGMGAFEGIRSYTQPDGSAGVWRLDEHLERLFDSLKMLCMDIDFTEKEIKRACLETLTANDFTEAYIRPLVFFGVGEMGLGARSNPVHVVIATWQWGAYLGDEGLRSGVSVKTSSFTRHHPNAALQRAKIIGHYVNSILARYEANEDGFDEAIMLDMHGFVAEGTGENVFIAKGDKIKTPPVANILPGITRRSIIEILEREGHQVQETWFGRDGFYVADEAWMVGTAAEVTPIREVDRRLVGKGKPGPLTRRLQELYSAAVRGNLDYMKQYITSPTLVE